MSKSQFNLQDAFLNQVRKEKMPVTIFLVNGFQIKGVVKGFDNFTVVVELDQKQQLVYKHAISTVAPLKPVNIATLDTVKHAEEE
ncbi:MAG TPA: RNA chaperone Hfq [Syntrophomonadaceae bacterium]|nr:RNA chaperone Hfq [Syntrophomonadaceae bacterium]